jgi:hypothetical protein
MSLDELNALMDNDLREDAYETQKAENIRYRGSRLADGH